MGIPKPFLLVSSVSSKQKRMAPNRLLTNPPPAEDSHEEVEYEEEEEEQSPAKEPEASESEDESASSIDSEETLPSHNASDLTTVEDSVKPKNREPVASTKRISPEPSNKRKGVASSGGDGEDGKRRSIQRLWSDEDVIAILEGLIEFQSEKGADPSADFYEFIKDSIHFDGFSKEKLNGKIRNLRQKYQNNARKGQDGEDPVFQKPHDHKSFQLSKMIWGAVESNDTGKIDKKSKDCESSDKSFEELMAAKVRANADEFWSAYPSLKKSMESMPESTRDFMKDTMGLVRRSKVKELDVKWRKLEKEEFEIYLTRAKLFLDISQALGLGQGN